jgi:protein-tyrosine-phosphatase
MKRVLFVCVENSCRSQMAEALANHYAKGRLEAFSAGSRPSGKVNPNAVQAMREIGIDLSSATSKGFDGLPHKEFDYAITLGCGDTCPFVSADKHIEWRIEDPKGKGMDFFIKTRDDIKQRIDRLLKLF